MPFSYDPIFAADPSNAANVAANASIIIFDPNDPGKAPVTITDVTGSPLPNPITVNKNGFGPAFQHATLDRVGWFGAGFTGYFTSYEGMKLVATDAAAAAQVAAATAGADAVAEVEALIAAGEFEGAPGQDGSNVLPTDTAIQQAITTPGTQTAAALTATIDDQIKSGSVPKWKATTAYTAGQAVLNPSGDVVTAKTGFTSGATYNAANWNLSASYATSAQVGAAYSLATAGKPSPKAAVSSMVSALQTGHGWTAITAASSNLNDTSDYVLGTQSAKITSNGTAGQMSLDKTSITVDATGKFLRFWLKVDDLSKLNSIQLYIGDANLANNYSGQIVNGTAAWRNTQSVVRSGEWTVLDVPFTDLITVAGTPSRAALTRVRLTVLDRNTGPVTVSLNGFALVSEQSVYPNGVISLTFDDNPAAQYTIARPYMDLYGYAGTLYPVIDQVDQPGQMTLAQMKKLQDQNGWDFGAHASTMAQHVAGFQSRTEADLVAEYETIRAWMRANGLRGESFAWPNGDSDTLAETVCSRYFRSARTVYNRTHEVLPPTNPYRLRAVNPTNMTLAQMKAEVDAAKAGKYWLNFIFHDIKTTKSQQNDVATADFQGLVDWINTQAVPVRTVSQVLATFG